MVLYYRKIGRRLFNESNFGLGIKSFKLMYKNIGLNLEHTKHKKLKLKHIKYLYKNETRFSFGRKLKDIKNLDRAFLTEVNCLRSLRFNLGLPCNGQRTQTNGRIAKLRQTRDKTVTKKSNYKQNMKAFNEKKRNKQDKRKIRIHKPKEFVFTRTFGDVYKRKKKDYHDIRKEQKSRIIRNIWSRNKRSKRIKKHMRSKASRLANKTRKKRR